MNGEKSFFPGTGEDFSGSSSELVIRVARCITLLFEHNYLSRISGTVEYWRENNQNNVGFALLPNQTADTEKEEEEEEEEEEPML